LLIKYIKSVLWRVAKCLSYVEEARCLKVKGRKLGWPARDKSVTIMPSALQQHSSNSLLSLTNS